MIILPDGNYPLNNTEEVLQHTLKLQNFFEKNNYLLFIYNILTGILMLFFL